MPNARGFKRQLQLAYDDKVIGGFVEFHKAVTLSLIREIVKSPVVWSGVYRQGHNVSVGRPDYTPPPDNPDAKATRWPDTPDIVFQARPLAEYARALSELKPFEKTYIATSVPYARRIEFDAHSRLAPAGVYGPAITVVKVKYSGALRSLTP